MTPKHKERIENLIESLKDYEHNGSFDRPDYRELMAVQNLIKWLGKRLKETVDELD